MNSQPDINYRVGDRDLKYYIFDWDNNILHMPTHIHLEHLAEDGQWHDVSVSTDEYAQIRHDTDHYRPPQGDWELAFREFRDIEIEDENAFVHHTKIAIDRVVSGRTASGPSFQSFKKVLIEGRLFAIVTARGHSPEIIREGVEYFIQHVLTEDETSTMLANLRGYLECFEPEHNVDLADNRAVLNQYLSLNRYHAVTWPSFLNSMGLPSAEPSAETGKQLAIREFVTHVVQIARERDIRKPVSFGFSDDDPANVRVIDEYIRSVLIKEFPAVKFVLYDTSDPSGGTGRKEVIHGQLTLRFSGEDE